jgi:hypothetical protein
MHVSHWHGGTGMTVDPNPKLGPNPGLVIEEKKMVMDDGFPFFFLLIRNC